MIKRKLLTVLLTLAMSMSAATVATFAESTDNGVEIKTADQLKAAMVSDMENGDLTEAEKKELLNNTTEAAVAELIEEKLDVAAELLNGTEIEADLKSQPDGTAYAAYQYDLGDGCRLVVELEDQAELVAGNMTGVLAATSGNNEQWKDYGYRYFTARATVECNVVKATLSLENHYTLSVNGIDERPGVADCKINSGKGLITHGVPDITDPTARTPGGSDVNMYCNYTVQALTASGTQSQKSTYRLNTTVKYLAIDKAGKRIRVGQAWSLERVL